MDDTQQKDREEAAVAWHAKWCQEHQERPDFIDAWLAGAAAERRRIDDELERGCRLIADGLDYDL